MNDPDVVFILGTFLGRFTSLHFSASSSIRSWFSEGAQGPPRSSHGRRQRSTKGLEETRSITEVSWT